MNCIEKKTKASENYDKVKFAKIDDKKIEKNKIKIKKRFNENYVQKNCLEHLIERK